MFEKEAEEYAGNREVCDLLDAISEDLQNYDYGTVAHYNIDPLVEECFKDGAEFGYNKAIVEIKDAYEGNGNFSAWFENYLEGKNVREGSKRKSKRLYRQRKATSSV